MSKKNDKLRTTFLLWLVSLGHPIIFFLYLYLLAGGSFGRKAVTILGIKSFYYQSTNVYAINIYLFGLFSLITYAIWIGLHTLILKKYLKSFNVHSYLKRKFMMGIPISSLGALNLYAWVGGMEGNIFSFFLSFPMLILVLIALSIYSVDLYKTVMNKK